MTDTPSDAVLSEFIDACRQIGRSGLVRCSSGNLSRRLDGGRMLATASRSWLENMTADDVSVCRIADGALLSGRKPTVEIAFHAAILRGRPDVNVVLHFQTPCATTLACQDTADVDFFVIPEIPFYIGPVARVPYLLPGSAELAAAVAAALQDHDLAVLDNHGQVTVAADYAHAIQNAEFFELACGVIVRGQGRTRPLSAAEAEALLALRHATARSV